MKDNNSMREAFEVNNTDEFIALMRQYLTVRDARKSLGVVLFSGQLEDLEVIWQAACKWATEQQKERGAQACREYKNRVSEQWTHLLTENPNPDLLTRDLINRAEGREMGADACEHLVLCDTENCELCAENDLSEQENNSGR